MPESSDISSGCHIAEIDIEQRDAQRLALDEADDDIRAQKRDQLQLQAEKHGCDQHTERPDRQRALCPMPIMQHHPEYEQQYAAADQQRILLIAPLHEHGDQLIQQPQRSDDQQRPAMTAKCLHASSMVTDFITSPLRI